MGKRTGSLENVNESGNSITWLNTLTNRASDENIKVHEILKNIETDGNEPSTQLDTLHW